MATEYENLEMGACLVTFKEIDLGLTKGGVNVTFSTDITDITADQFGDTIIDTIIKGRKVVVKVPMAESDLTKLASTIPGSTLVGTTTKKLVIKAAVGTSLRALAGPLVLHPKARAVGDLSKDVTINLAQAKGDFSYAYKHDEQRIYEVEFTGFVDLETDELFTLGDPAAVTV